MHYLLRRFLRLTPPPPRGPPISPPYLPENIGPFYAISFGAFEGGGCIAVESGPLEVTHVTTFHQFAKIDGRFPHWVTPYTGTRYSFIYYQTIGEVVPVTTAVRTPPQQPPQPQIPMPLTTPTHGEAAATAPTQ
jgi:hypothetical protein